MFLLDRMLTGGLGFVFRRVADAVDSELNDVDGLRERLLSAQLAFEEGEISDQDFAEIEADVLARIRALRGDSDEGLTTLNAQVVGVEATFDDDEAV